jgi:hypothetical protein
MGITTEQLKPSNLCALEGCYTHLKNKRRKYCSRECHEKAIGARIPTCHNPACKIRVKRGRNLYCSWTCYKVDNDTHAHETCQRVGCDSPLTSRKSTRKYCSQECYKLDQPNRPSRKVIRLCILPDCGKQIIRRGTTRKYCSVQCSVKARKARKLKDRSCPNCETKFEPKRLRQVYCSEKCQFKENTLSIKKVRNLPRRFTKINKKWVLTSNVVWEKHNGPLSSGMDVWFIDENSFNDMEINNLYLVSHKEYLVLSKKVTQYINESEEEILKKGDYEGRTEISKTPAKKKKEEFFDYNKELF